MRSVHCLLIVSFFIANLAVAQDTIPLNSEENAWQSYVNTIDMNDNELEQEGSPLPSSMLLAGRNYFLNIYGFSFFNVHYRQRGYENFSGRTYVNGIPINSLENNSVQYNLFSGMSNVFRVTETSEQLAMSNFTFGGLGNHFSINSNPSAQRNTLRVGYSYSNRNYQHRFSGMYRRGVNSHGWDYTLAFNARYSREGYFPGTYTNGWGYLMSIEKKWKRNSLIFTIWGSDNEAGRQNSAVKETFDLTHSNSYNPSWGYQNGKTRNANILKNFLPTAVINYKANYGDKLYWNTGAGMTIGNVSYSGLEWYNAPDPRPDYYRYLPSFFKNDNIQYETLSNEMSSHPQLLQIDWNKMYQINMSQQDGRALYALGSRVTEHIQLNAASTINAILSKQLTLSGGIEWQRARLRYYKRLEDLLGGQYWVNINSYIERDNPSDINIIQNDINHPNEKITANHKYSYDYTSVLQRFSEWVQLYWTTRRWDIYAAIELNSRQLYRIGNVRNGLFPDNSFGKDPTRTDLLLNGKWGATYKLDGRKYIFLNAAIMQQPANPNDIYLSPTTRNFKSDSVSAASIRTAETGFVLNAPSLRLRTSAYYTTIKQANEFRYFYDDVHQNFASYHLNNIGKKHYGIELAADWKFFSNWNYSFAGNFSQSFYNNHPRLLVLSETSPAILTNEEVYLKNYRIPNTPQTIVHNSIGYRNGVCFFNLNANAFFNRWSAVNPMRRTVSVLQDINPVTQKDLLDNLLRQEKLPNGSTLDFFGGYSFPLRGKNYSKNKRYIDLLLSCNNMLSNKNIVAYAYEQMRIDMKGYDVNKFPNKYNYAMGRNYSAHITLRF